MRVVRCIEITLNRQNAGRVVLLGEQTVRCRNRCDILMIRVIIGHLTAGIERQ